MWEGWCCWNGGIYLKSETLTIEVQFPINPESSVILDRITRQVLPSAKFMKTARRLAKRWLTLDLMMIRLLLWCETALSGSRKNREVTEKCLWMKKLWIQQPQSWLEWGGPPKFDIFPFSHCYIFYYFLIAHENSLFPSFKNKIPTIPWAESFVCLSSVSFCLFLTHSLCVCVGKVTINSRLFVF